MKTHSLHRNRSSQHRNPHPRPSRCPPPVRRHRSNTSDTVLTYSAVLLLLPAGPPRRCVCRPFLGREVLATPLVPRPAALHRSPRPPQAKCRARSPRFLSRDLPRSRHLFDDEPPSGSNSISISPQTHDLPLRHHQRHQHRRDQAPQIPARKAPAPPPQRRAGVAATFRRAVLERCRAAASNAQGDEPGVAFKRHGSYGDASQKEELDDSLINLSGVLAVFF